MHLTLGCLSLSQVNHCHEEEVSISNPQLQIGLSESMNLCLNLRSR